MKKNRDEKNLDRKNFLGKTARLTKTWEKKSWGNKWLEGGKT